MSNNTTAVMNEQDSQIIIYHPEGDSPKVSVRLKGETAWLSQAQMAELFGVQRPAITKHLQNIFQEAELEESSVSSILEHTAADGKNYKTLFYNLDAIISVGYRVNSTTATKFRQWATTRLREYIVKGFTMNDDLLKETGGGSYWKELLDRIRDIRSSEKVLYRQVLDMYATSVDYDPKSEQSRQFFQIIQNKLHYGAHGKTAAEVIHGRANANKPFMGLLTFSSEQPTSREITIAKNYLDESELKKLNTLVSAFFDAAEFRAENQQKTYMRDWVKNLDSLIAAVEGKKLEGAGKISKIQADTKAKSEFKKYRKQIIDQPSSAERDYLSLIKQAERKVKKQASPDRKTNINRTKNESDNQQL